MEVIISGLLASIIPSPRARFLLDQLSEHRRLVDYAVTGHVPYARKSGMKPPSPLSLQQELEYGREVIAKYAAYAGDDLWLVHEQVFIAALALRAKSDSKDPKDNAKVELLATASDSLKALKSRFLNSQVRIPKLEGMLFESQSRWEKALETYHAILEVDEANQSVRKRIICTLLGQNKRSAAIVALLEYLDVFMGDVEAWEQLADLYVLESKLDVACFALEEILLMRPLNWAYFLKYADLQARIGTADSLVLARKYYCKVLELQPDCVEALRAVKSCSDQLDSLRTEKKQPSKKSLALFPESDIIAQLNILVATKMKDLQVVSA